MTEQEYYQKKREVLDKFNAEFVKDAYMYDAAFHNIVSMLIRDANPYAIIEELIKDRQRLYEAYKNQIQNYRP